MTTADASLAIKLFGTEVPEPATRTLRAGALSAVLDNGALRYIKLGDVEVLRAIAYLVRDENWGTFTPAITNLTISENAKGFAVNYDAFCQDAKRTLRYKAVIACDAIGNLKFEVAALPETDVLTNRTGFIVLHPLKGVAGRPLTVEKVDGSVVQSEFPMLIDPDCPFRDVRALTHEILPGLKVTCRMEGDAFEMEDHRNWTDASFKTYVRPLSRPWPYTLPKGVAFGQSVSLTFAGPLPAAKPAGAPAPVEISIGQPMGWKMPQIGLGVPAEEARASADTAELVKIAGPQVLICQLDARRKDGDAAMTDYRRLAEATGAAVTLEIIVPGKPGMAAAELAPLAEQVRKSGLKLAAVTVSPAPHLKAVLPGSKIPNCVTYEELYAAARAAFPGVRLGGGMYSYFTELNRTKPPAALLDFVTHTNAPIVHAADDISVMETLEALPFVIQSTKAFIGGKPYRVGPSAIPARDNPYGAASAENPDNGRVCLAKMDPRQRGLFGAAWTLGYIAAFANGGLEAVSIGSATGPSGIIARKTDYAQPWFDDVGGLAVYPVFHVIAALTKLAGRDHVAASSSDPARVAVLGYAGGIFLANLTGADQAVRLPASLGGAKLRVLDAASFAELTTDPGYFGTGGQPVSADRTIQLSPYAVAHILTA